MSKIILFLQESWLLVFASMMFGLLLAVAKAGLQPRITANEVEALNNKMTELIGDADDFALALGGVEIATKKGKPLVTDVYQALDTEQGTVGYAFVAIGSGFADKIKIVIAVDRQFDTLLGFKVLASNETPGFGDKIKEPFFQGQFVDAPVSKLELVKVGDPEAKDEQIVAISGATVSSDAIVSIVNAFACSVRASVQEKGLIADE